MPKRRKPIKDLVRDSGRTYADLGAEIGMTPQGVSNIVNGATQGPTPRYALAKALGRTPSEIVWPEPDSDLAAVA